jgi:hypothetical protein
MSTGLAKTRRLAEMNKLFAEMNNRQKQAFQKAAEKLTETSAPGSDTGNPAASPTQVSSALKAFADLGAAWSQLRKGRHGPRR